MAQRTEKEETEFKAVPETLTLCVNNCGVIGTQATNNMCQKCFNSIKTTTTSTASLLGGRTRLPSHIDVDVDVSVDLVLDQPVFELKETNTIEAVGVVVKKEVNRCSGCRKRVGLTGFRCRCGDLFCSEHRYSDRHDCSFDYKTAGREVIARDNPVVKAPKIVRI